MYVARKDVPEAERERFARALLALTEGKDHPVLEILRATQFVAANDQEYALMRQMAHELKMFRARSAQPSHVTRSDVPRIGWRMEKLGDGGLQISQKPTSGAE